MAARDAGTATDGGDAWSDSAPDATEDVSVVDVDVDVDATRDSDADQGRIEPDATRDAAADHGVDADVAGPSDAADRGDGSVCDVERPVTKVGCLETPLPPMITIDGVATPIAGYACTGDGVDTMVRLRACISPPSNPCLADAGETLCAVIDIPASVLSSFPPDGTMRLDGATTFTFLSPLDTEVRPENVMYTPAQANGVTRVWMEAKCFCTPVPPLTGSQALTGGLTITQATSQRIIGRIALSADGHISPVNHRERRIDLDTFFDVKLRIAPAE